MSTVGDGSRLVFGFEDLAEVILGEHNRVFLFHGFERSVADVQQICTHGTRWAVLLDNSEWQQTDTFGLLDRFDKVRTGQLFPISRQRLTPATSGGQRRDQNQPHRYVPLKELR